MKLYKAVATITIFTLMTRLLGFVLRIFLSRELGAEGMGIYQVAFSVFIVLLTVTSSGVPLIVSRQTAKYKEAGERKRIHSLVTSALFLGTLVSTTISGIVLVFQKPISALFSDETSLKTLLMLLPAVVASGIYAAFHGAIWGEKRYFLSSFNEFLEQVIRILVCVALFKFTSLDKSFSTGISLSVACVASMIIGISMYFIYGGRLRKFDKELAPLIKSSASITGIRLAGSVVGSLTSLLLPVLLMWHGLTKSQALAEIGTVLGMVFPLLYLPTAFIGALASVLVPELSGTKSNEQKRKKVESSTSISILIAAICVPVFLGAGANLGTIVYNSAEAGRYITLSGVIMIPLAIEQITSSMMNSLDLEFRGFINYLVGAGVLIIAIVAATPLIGTVSFLIGTFLQLTVSSILDIIAIKKRIGIKLTFLKPLVVSTLLCLPVTALMLSLNKLLAFAPQLISTIAICLVGVISMTLLCLSLGLFEIAGARIGKLTKNKKSRTATSKPIKGKAIQHVVDSQKPTTI